MTNDLIQNKNSQEFINRLITMAAQGCEVPVSIVTDCSNDWPKFTTALFKLRSPIPKAEMKPDKFQNLTNQTLKFPCPETGEIVKLSHCFDCPKSQKCDIYASMLSEDYD